MCSHPFGGCSSVVDALLVGNPVVSLSGSQYANRCGPHLLETVGLHERCDHATLLSQSCHIDERNLAPKMAPQACRTLTA